MLPSSAVFSALSFSRFSFCSRRACCLRFFSRRSRSLSVVVRSLLPINCRFCFVFTKVIIKPRQISTFNAGDAILLAIKPPKEPMWLWWWRAIVVTALGISPLNYSTSGLISTGKGDCLQQANHLSNSPSHPGQLSLQPSAGWEMSTSQNCGDALPLCSKGRYGSFHLWINVRMAGKTVWSLVNVPFVSTLGMSHDKALYKSTFTLLLLVKWSSSFP